MAKDQMTYVEQISETVLMVRENGTFRRLDEYQLKTIPAVGHYFYNFHDRTVYNIDAVMHDDMHVYLIVSPAPQGDPFIGVGPVLYAGKEG